MTPSQKQSRLEWKRAQRMRWTMEGFKLARMQAEQVCRDLAEALDDRSEQARIIGVNPSERVRRLKQAAHLIATMSRPPTPPKHADPDDGEATI